MTKTAKKKTKIKGKAEPLAKTVKKNAMMEALRKNLGIVSASCKMAGISRWTHYDWIDKDLAYKKEVESISEEAIDFAEGKLLGRINVGDTIATIFYLKTKGKTRGYVEKTEVDNTIKTAQPIIIDWSGANDSSTT